MPNKEARKPQSQPWTVEVDVYLKSDATPPDFEIESFLKSGPDGRLVFNNCGRPGFNVVFRLHDETGLGYHFPSPPRLNDACWSQRGGDACPHSEIMEIFDPVRVFDDGTALTVRNENPCPAQGEFTYTLRVTKGDGSYLELDPGGLNQNGNSRL
jgi:hypothetical protein